MLLSLYPVTLLLTFGASFSWGEKPGRPRFEPLPKCQECVSLDRFVASGVGFDLTPSYGTAAIRFHNGSVVDIGKIDGDDSYKSLMKRLSVESSRPPSGQPKFESIWDELKYLIEQAKMQINKRRGFPATEDVGTIGSLLKQLRFECEKNLGHSVTAAIAAMPTLPGITVEDLADVMEYAGLATLRSYNYLGDVTETPAAFAGMGYGLCSNPRDIDACEGEEAEIPRKPLLAIELTDSFFTATHAILHFAHSNGRGGSVLDDTLGLGALNSYPDASSYWDMIRAEIVSIAAATSKPIDTLLLLGESGADERLLDVIRGAFENS